MKLGPGGLSDVEWTVQLLQLRRRQRAAALRTTRTAAAMAAAVEGDCSPPATQSKTDRRVASRRPHQERDRAGRKPAGDTLPARHTELTAVARLLGYPPGDAAQALEQDYRRAARRARAVMEPLFYG